LNEEEAKNVQWRFGAPPNYAVVNKLFEEGRTEIWPVDSLEEKVQNLLKTWEMELLHRSRFEEWKSCNPEKLTISVNGRKALTMEGVAEIGGSYNNFLQTSLPQKLRGYDPIEYTNDASHLAFTTTFPRGFALEILQVYTGPPVIVLKFRHWGFMEGPFQGHSPTNEKAEFHGIAIFEVDEQWKIVKVEFFYDRGELLGGLMKGEGSDHITPEVPAGCPFLKNTG